MNAEEDARAPQGRHRERLVNPSALWWELCERECLVVGVVWEGVPCCGSYAGVPCCGSCVRGSALLWELCRNCTLIRIIKELLLVWYAIRVPIVNTLAARFTACGTFMSQVYNNATNSSLVSVWIKLLLSLLIGKDQVANLYRTQQFAVNAHVTCLHCQ